MDATEQARKLIKSRGLRVTGSRAALVQAMLQAGEPVSLETATALAGAAAGDQATVYRNLQALSTAGLLRAVKGVGRREMYELAVQPHGHGHSHMACTKCGRVECVDLRDVPAKPRDLKGWNVSELSVTVWGICPQCT